MVMNVMNVYEALVYFFLYVFNEFEPAHDLFQVM